MKLAPVKSSMNKSLYPNFSLKIRFASHPFFSFYSEFVLGQIVLGSLPLSQQQYSTVRSVGSYLDAIM